MQLLGIFDLAPSGILGTAAARQGDAELQKDIAGEAGAVEGLGPLGTIAVGLAEVLDGLLEDEVGGVGQAVELAHFVTQRRDEHLVTRPSRSVPRSPVHGVGLRRQHEGQAQEHE